MDSSIVNSEAKNMTSGTGNSRLRTSVDSETESSSVTQPEDEVDTES